MAAMQDFVAVNGQPSKSTYSSKAQVAAALGWGGSRRAEKKAGPRAAAAATEVLKFAQIFRKRLHWDVFLAYIIVGKAMSLEKCESWHSTTPPCVPALSGLRLRCWECMAMMFASFPGD